MVSWQQPLVLFIEKIYTADYAAAKFMTQLAQFFIVYLMVTTKTRDALTGNTCMMRRLNALLQSSELTANPLMLKSL